MASIVMENGQDAQKTKQKKTPHEQITAAAATPASTAAAVQLGRG